MSRPSHDENFMKVARVISERATCKRRYVGAVLARGVYIVSTGYNGAPRGMKHCWEADCDIVAGHCVRAVHAEANALIQAGVAGAATSGTTLYTTTSPCQRCMGLIINAGIERVVYAEAYKAPEHDDEPENWVLKAARETEVAMIHLPDPNAYVHRPAGH